MEGRRGRLSMFWGVEMDMNLAPLQLGNNEFIWPFRKTDNGLLRKARMWKVFHPMRSAKEEIIPDIFSRIIHHIASILAS